MNGPGEACRVLLCRAGEVRFALRLELVERVERMVALSGGLPPTPPRAGFVTVHGALMVVIDSRPLLGQLGAAPSAEQHLLVLRAPSPHALWVGAVDGVAPAQLPRPELARLESGALLPLLHPDAAYAGALA